MKKMEKEKMEKMEKGKKNQLEKMEKMEKEKKGPLEKMEKMEKDSKDQQKKIDDMETEKIEQEERLEKIKSAKKKVEEKRDTEVAKARKTSEEEVKRAKSDFTAALAIKENTISEQATRIAGLEGKTTTLGDEVDETESAFRTELDSEKSARLDAQQKAKEAEGRVEVLKGKLAYVLEQNDVLGASLIDVKKPQAHVQNEGDEELDHGDLKDAENAPLGIQRGRLQYNRNKLRINKRVDGSIYTSKHPQNTPALQPEDQHQSQPSNRRPVRPVSGNLKVNGEKAGASENDIPEVLNETLKTNDRKRTLRSSTDQIKSPSEPVLPLRIRSTESKGAQVGWNIYKNKLRGHKRADGSIYTSKHPPTTPSQQQDVGQHRPADEQGALNGQQHPEAQLDTAPEGLLCQVPTPAPIQQANNE